MLPTSFSAAGIFFCFLEKEKAPDFPMGESDVEAQRSPRDKRQTQEKDKHRNKPRLWRTLMQRELHNREQHHKV